MGNMWNPEAEEFKEIADEENGTGYSKNLKVSGCIIKLPDNHSKMLYEIKNIENIRVVIIKYITYDSEKALLNLLAFFTQFIRNLNPHLIYYKEKEREAHPGDFLKKYCKFNKTEIPNKLQNFNCFFDSGNPCTCDVYEFVGYKDKGGEQDE